MNEFDITEAMEPFANAIRAYLQKNNEIAVPEGFIESLVNDPNLRMIATKSAYSR